jgi:hypothetical protein
MLVHVMEVWNISLPFGILFVHWVILWSVGVFQSVLVYCIMKNLATLGLTLETEPFLTSESRLVFVSAETIT